MYADRHDSRRPLNTASLTIAIAINAAVVAAIAFSAPTVGVLDPAPPLKIIEIAPLPIPDPLPLPDPQPHPRQTRAPRPDQPTPDVDRPVDTAQPVFVDPGPPLGGTADTGPAGSGATPDPLPPAIVEPALDARFASDFQPQYPPDERRAGREGRVVLRVLVGVDGRVRQVERVSATSESFYTAAARQALTKWRFRAGTQGGIPIERWRRVGVSFRLEGGY